MKHILKECWNDPEKLRCLEQHAIPISLDNTFIWSCNFEGTCSSKVIVRWVIQVIPTHRQLPPRVGAETVTRRNNWITSVHRQLTKQ